MPSFVPCTVAPSKSPKALREAPVSAPEPTLSAENALLGEVSSTPGSGGSCLSVLRGLGGLMLTVDAYLRYPQVRSRSLSFSEPQQPPPSVKSHMIVTSPPRAQSSSR